MQEASIIEIFSSFQGEGPFVGENHLFVRFQDCEFNCKWCDTPKSFVENKFCRAESPPFSKKQMTYPNPISVAGLNEILQGFDQKTIVVTGGEPLQKTPFLKEWLPTLKGKKVLLETAGIHFPELPEVIPYVTHISVDLKLPSSTGMHPWWREHENFLKLASKKEVYVKVVVTQGTEDRHLERAASLVASIDPQIPFILQPATETPRFHEMITPEKIYQFFLIAQSRLKEVRVIPQIQKQLGIP